jgi:hypothetical protein
MKKIFCLPASEHLSASLPPQADSCASISLINKFCRFILFFTFHFSLFTLDSSAQQKTYCNPINIDYGYTPIPNFSEWGRHRATADPVIVLYKNDYYLFSTNQWGLLVEQ